MSDATPLTEGAPENTATPSQAVDTPQGASTEIQQLETHEVEKAPEASKGAPEKYDFKAAEGKTFDTAITEGFAEAAKEANLTQDAAQKMLDRMAPVLEKRQVDAIAAARTEWQTSAKADKEFGGDKFDENMATANKAFKAFGNEALKALLEKSGLGDHPEIIRAFYKAGKAISADKPVIGSAAPPDSEKSRAEILYPTSARS
jgi:hypothetical protein